jgi:hypothetical protein
MRVFGHSISVAASPRRTHLGEPTKAIISGHGQLDEYGVPSARTITVITADPGDGWLETAPMVLIQDGSMNDSPDSVTTVSTLY